MGSRCRAEAGEAFGVYLALKLAADFLLGLPPHLSSRLAARREDDVAWLSLVSLFKALGGGWRAG